MEIKPEKFILNIENARKELQTADHLVYVTFPLLKEQKLFLKVLECLQRAIVSLINAILQYEYYYKRITLYKDPKENFNTFKRISKNYGIGDEQLKKIIKILNIAEKHRKSPFEFIKNDKIVIMENGIKTDTISLEEIKQYLIETKDFFRKVNLKIK